MTLCTREHVRRSSVRRAGWYGGELVFIAWFRVSECRVEAKRKKPEACVTEKALFYKIFVFFCKKGRKAIVFRFSHRIKKVFPLTVRLFFWCFEKRCFFVFSRLFCLAQKQENHDIGWTYWFGKWDENRIFLNERCLDWHIRISF